MGESMQDIPSLFEKALLTTRGPAPIHRVGQAHYSAQPL